MTSVGANIRKRKRGVIRDYRRTAADTVARKSNGRSRCNSEATAVPSARECDNAAVVRKRNDSFNCGSELGQRVTRPSPYHVTLFSGLACSLALELILLSPPGLGCSIVSYVP